MTAFAVAVVLVGLGNILLVLQVAHLRRAHRRLLEDFVSSLNDVPDLDWKVRELRHRVSELERTGKPARTPYFEIRTTSLSLSRLARAARSGKEQGAS